MKQAIEIRGARENNLKDIDLEIPREQLIVVTGLSGCGKSSLAFDTVYAEGQRRFLESLSAYAKRFISKVRRPEVDFVLGLSPVISIDQKVTDRNPRSTVATVADINDYMRVLYTVIGVAHCPYCEREIPTKTSEQMLERLIKLPEGAVVELRAPVFKIYGEEYAYLFGEIRSQGYRRILINGVSHNIIEEIELDEDTEYRMEVITDKFIVDADQDNKLMLASIEDGLRMGQGHLGFHMLNADEMGYDVEEFYKDFTCPQHAMVMGEPKAGYFAFNLTPKPRGATLTFSDTPSGCRTCLGIGTTWKVHPDLLVPDKYKSVRDGAFHPGTFRYSKNTWDGQIMWSLVQHYSFSIDTPFKELPDEVVALLFYGTKGKKIKVLSPEGANNTSDQPLESINHLLERNASAVELEAAIERLTSTEQEVARLHLGLAGEPSLRLREIAARLGQTEALIWRIRHNAFRKVPTTSPQQSMVHRHVGKQFRFDGIITRIERRYRDNRKKGIAHYQMEE